jgi:hypothetical protein
VASSIEEALSLLLIGRPRPPSTFNEVVEAFGDTSRTQNPAIARALTELSEGRLPRRGTEQRRAYDSAMRRVHRYRTTGVERRRPGPAVLAELRRLARRHLGAETADRVKRNGAWMRLTASIRVSDRWVIHTMPADVAGGARQPGQPRGSGMKPRWQYLDGRSMTSVVDRWMDGDFAGAAAELLEAFFRAYWGDPDPCEVGRIDNVELKE